MAGNKTLLIIKPDAVGAGHTGSILNIVIDKGFKINALQMFHLQKREVENFYAIHKGKSFFESLVKFMSSGPVVVTMLEKPDAVDDLRTLIGNTDPLLAQEGTIRKKYGKFIQQNAVHASDSDENAERECNFFFSKLNRVGCEQENTL